VLPLLTVLSTKDLVSDEELQLGDMNMERPELVLTSDIDIREDSLSGRRHQIAGTWLDARAPACLQMIFNIRSSGSRIFAYVEQQDTWEFLIVRLTIPMILLARDMLCNIVVTKPA
jgi:hypothetical protein